MGVSDSVWISCTDCGHTSRALSVMAKRVLADRRACPRCGSDSVPLLQATPAGAHISRPEWERKRLETHESGVFTSFIQPESPRPVSWMRAIARILKAKLS